MLLNMISVFYTRFHSYLMQLLTFAFQLPLQYNSCVCSCLALPLLGHLTEKVFGVHAYG